MKLLIILLSSFVLIACNTAQKSNNNSMSFADKFRDHSAIKSPEEIATHKFGSYENPVRVDMPEGEHEYLAKLTCSDGSRIAYRRGGSAGVGPYGNMLDVYNVSCFIDSTLKEFQIYMDMYHPKHEENKAVEGFIFSGK